MKHRKMSQWKTQKTLNHYKDNFRNNLLKKKSPARQQSNCINKKKLKGMPS